MTTAPNEGNVSSGSHPMCECCFTRHVGQCTIKCHKCGKVRHKERYCKEKSVVAGANAQPIWTCYDCCEQGHMRNRCPKKVKKEETREVRGRVYAIKAAEPQGLNVVTGTFLLNNRYAYVLFDSGSDRSFVDTRFSSMLDIDPVKIDTSYEVELTDGRIVSTNTVLKGCTFNLVNHLFEIDLMSIELGTFDVIIGIDWLVKHDAVIVYGEKCATIAKGRVTWPETVEHRLGMQSRYEQLGQEMGRELVMSVEDPNVVTGMYSLNNLYAIMLFDSGADFSFISTKFVPLLNEKPSIANPSFDVIVGMDWLSNQKAVIVCHEKIVRIPVEEGKVLCVQGERNVGKTKTLMSTKANEPTLSDIPIVRDFEDVFLNDLSGLPPQRQVEFRIDLIPEATPVAKSPYRLAPSEMQELS
ncbi:reverse transcriptase domain-containing protein [Tanacetum coccineum]